MHKQDISTALAMVEQARPDIAAVIRPLPISYVAMPPGTLANYVPEYDQGPAHIELNDQLTTLYESEDIAATLVHEGTHALDDQAGILGDGSDLDDVIPAEQRAKHAELAFIKDRNPHGKPVRDAYDKDTVKSIAAEANGTLDDRVAEIYTDSYMERVLSEFAGNDR